MNIVIFFETEIGSVYCNYYIHLYTVDAESEIWHDRVGYVGGDGSVGILKCR